MHGTSTPSSSSPRQPSRSKTSMICFSMTSMSSELSVTARPTTSIDSTKDNIEWSSTGFSTRIEIFWKTGSKKPYIASVGNGMAATQYSGKKGFYHTPPIGSLVVCSYLGRLWAKSAFLSPPRPVRHSVISYHTL